MTVSLKAALGAAILCLALPCAASAHVSLETASAVANSTYKAVLRVPHGCGAAATVKIRLRIPEGFIAVKPSPKAGWSVEIVKGKYDHPYNLHGSEVTEGVKELSWTGNLPDAYYDEFVFRGTLTDAFPAGSTVYFPVVQECEGGKSEHWIDIPSAGAAPSEHGSPAPSLDILAPAK